ncbi:HSP90 family protein [Streptacidiphilus rugosus]|uniref:HSP90 family protein n=1 Tax=Streptacidiphilus rugosus TaxID=405783 RepID=UPI00055D132E|nr:HSP90 family protein [Streptacidiphilus rugosus]
MTADTRSTAHTFQVDLRGLVDLLSHHLYSSPRVYVRELLQNAVDAVTARRLADPDAPAVVRLRAGDGTLRVDDSGVGLTEADVHSLLATIGRSSKRDGLESARAEFLGQFGIGLLACFVVAQEIRVVTRSARDASAPPVEWLARDDGSYTVRTLTDDARPEPGTTVELTARRGSEEWLAPARVLELARDFGSLLPYDVAVVDADGGEHAVTELPAVWDRPFPTPSARRVALASHCHTLFGFEPLDVIELDLPAAGVRGVGYVLPAAANPSQRGGHRVSLKGMLLTDRAEGLLPDWAFFVRCVLDTDALRPTASRESLYEDETLAAVRDALGVRVRDWLTGLAAGDPDRLGRFLQVHQLGVKSLARHDPELLRLMLPWLTVETTAGRTTLAELTRDHQQIHLAGTVEEFRQIAPIAQAQGIAVVNGGYTYDADVTALLPGIVPGVAVSDLDAGAVTARLDLVDAGAELALAPFLATARARLEPLGCDVVLRSFEPVGVPALYLDDREARHERSRADAEAGADALWAGILGALRGSAPRAQLVLNHHNPLVRRIAGIAEPELAGVAVESLYGQALLLSRRPLTAADSALLNRSFLGLLDWATHTPASRPEENR